MCMSSATSQPSVLSYLLTTGETCVLCKSTSCFQPCFAFSWRPNCPWTVWTWVATTHGTSLTPTCAKFNIIWDSPEHNVDHNVKKHTLQGSLPHQDGLQVGQDGLVGPQSGLKSRFDSPDPTVSLAGTRSTSQRDTRPLLGWATLRGCVFHSSSERHLRVWCRRSKPVKHIKDLSGGRWRAAARSRC